MNNECDDDRITCGHCGRRNYPEVGMSLCECFWERRGQPNQQPCSEEDLRKEIAYMQKEVNSFFRETEEFMNDDQELNWGCQTILGNGNFLTCLCPQCIEEKKAYYEKFQRRHSQNQTSKRGTKFQGAYVHQRQFVKEKSPNNVTPIPVEPKFPKEDELFQRLNAVVSDYSGELSLVATVGVLELLKLAIIERTK